MKLIASDDPGQNIVGPRWFNIHYECNWLGVYSITTNCTTSAAMVSSLVFKRYMAIQNRFSIINVETSQEQEFTVKYKSAKHVFLEMVSIYFGFKGQNLTLTGV